jgi:adenylate kinase family enzyme
MKKVMIVGCGGSGKSTLAEKLGPILGLPVYHLDKFYWKSNWTPTPKADWQKIHADLCAQGNWIIDGNYTSTMDSRMNACDTIIFLDFSRILCFSRVLKRLIDYRFKVRRDMAEGCNEKIDLEFLNWIWNYPKNQRPYILSQFEILKNKKKIYILKSPREVQDFFIDLKNESKPNLKNQFK